MKYVRPELWLINNAMALIEGEPPGSKIGVVIEGGRTHVTAPAYEADE